MITAIKIIMSILLPFPVALVLTLLSIDSTNLSHHFPSISIASNLPSSTSSVLLILYLRITRCICLKIRSYL